MAKNNKEWNPEYRFQSVKGQFTDYTGATRDYTMVAVSIPANTMLYQGPEFAGFVAVTGGMKVEKVLSIGVAVRCNRDEDNGMGDRIAYGKAVKKMEHVLAVTHAGMVNTTMVDALLRQEALFFEKDPGMYLNGYNKDKTRFEKTGKIAQAEMKNPSADTTNTQAVETVPFVEAHTVVKETENNDAK